jgi:polyhydroxyalkanoate synthesis regulator phasin
MALDKNDIELLRQMMTEVSREVSREVCGELIKESETRMMAYIENHIEKKLDMTIEAVNASNERIDRLTNRIDDLSETTLANTLYIVKNASGKNPPQAQ